MSEESDLEKTEDPTPHRIEKAREKGQIPRSRELTSILMLATGLAILLLGGEYLARALAVMIAQGLHFDHLLLSNDRQMLIQLGMLLQQAVAALMPVLLGLMLVGWCAPMLIGGFLFSPSSIKCDLNRLNPLSGFKRMFSSQVLAELLKGILKATLVGWVCGWFLLHYWPRMLRLITEPTLDAMGDALHLVGMCGLLVVLGLLPMVGFDVFYQVWSNLSKLRMTKQEIKDEFKE
ncbi:MAG: EscU/YscU/HrcU family type III secretion system export apparatus switch protein, partial [Edwardsiella piscicida]